MLGVDRKLKELYPSQLQAEAALDIPQPRLSQLRCLDIDKFSIGWLLKLAEKIGAKVDVTVG